MTEEDCDENADEVLEDVDRPVVDGRHQQPRYNHQHHGQDEAENFNMYVRRSQASTLK